MTDQSTVFDKKDNDQETPGVVKPQSGDDFSDQLKAITAEDGRQKYGSVEKALEALSHSQTLIPTLQQQVTALELEKQTLREELAGSKSAQEIVEELAKHQQQGQEGNPSETHFGEEEVAKLIQATLDKRAQEQTTVSNTAKVDNALKAAFGEKAPEIVLAKAKELNTTPEALGALAATSPDMVLALFQAKSTSPSPTSSSYNLGFNEPKKEELGRPEKSLMAGASSKDVAEYMRKIRDSVYEKHGIDN